MAQQRATMKTERDNKDAPITRSITREMQIAFRDVGASEEEVTRIPFMSVEELCDLRRKLKVDPYLVAYIRFWGDALPDEEILYFLQRWNSWAFECSPRSSTPASQGRATRPLMRMS
jgi:hypothetical protein